MKIFRDYTFTWWQVGVLKASIVCFGIAIGANWPQIFAQYTTVLIVIAVVLGVYLSTIFFKE